MAFKAWLAGCFRASSTGDRRLGLALSRSPDDCRFRPRLACVAPGVLCGQLKKMIWGKPMAICLWHLTDASIPATSPIVALTRLEILECWPRLQSCCRCRRWRCHDRLHVQTLDCKLDACIRIRVPSPNPSSTIPATTVPCVGAVLDYNALVSTLDMSADCL